MRRFWALTIILFLMIFTAGCGSNNKFAQKTVVSTKVIQEENIIESIDSTGRIIAEFSVDVVARIDGYLQKKFFKEGASVKKGDLLYQIEPYTYAAKVSEASANLRNSQAALKDSSKNLIRAEQLVKQDYISKADYDNKLALRDKDKASVDSNRAALTQAQINYGYTKIYSPINGKIGKIFITEGNYVTPTSGTLVKIVSVDPIFVDFTLKSKEYLSLKKTSKVDDLSDMSVRITLADDTVYSKEGKIDFIDNTIDQSSGSVLIRAKFENKDGLLVPGDYVSAKITLNKPQTVIMIPQEAVLDSVDGKYVYTIDENNKANKTFIKVSDEYHKNWIVTEGLNVGDVIATTGLQYLRTGSEVICQSNTPQAMQNKKVEKKQSLIKRLLRKIKHIFAGQKG